MNRWTVLLAAMLFAGFVAIGCSGGGDGPVDPPCNEDSDTHDSNGDNDAFLIKYMPDGCW